MARVICLHCQRAERLGVYVMHFHSDLRGMGPAARAHAIRARMRREALGRPDLRAIV